MLRPRPVAIPPETWADYDGLLKRTSGVLQLQSINHDQMGKQPRGRLLLARAQFTLTETHIGIAFSAEVNGDWNLLYCANRYP
jgi:hypothetical protein